jgi:hypothetical protein
VCLAVPDALGEPGEAVLRAALPVHMSRTWLIPRAVAAALALRSDQPDAIAPDDSLLVLDWGPLGFEARLLVLRYDTSVGQSADPRLWECPVPWEPVEMAAVYPSRSHWLELARAAVPQGTKSEYVSGLVDSGLINELAVDAMGTAGASLFGERGRLGALACVTADMVDAAVARAVLHFSTWLAQLGRAKVLDHIAEQTAGRRLHVILAGDPLEIPCLARGLRECCEKTLPTAILHEISAGIIARGAAEFVRRRSLGLPTFELALPDLYLLARGASGTAVLKPIFEKYRVRPGQEIRVPPIAFELPAHVQRIELPLRRDPNGRRPLAWSAIIEEQLAAELQVELHVIYRYAEDGFRILIRPRAKPGHEPPFQEREIRWVRSSMETTERKLVDEPPDFADIGISPEPPPATRVRACLDAVALFHVEANKFLDEYARSGNPAGSKAFEQRFIAAEKSLAALLMIAPLSALDASTRSSLLEKWLFILCQLAALRPGPHELGKKKTSNWASKLNSLRKQTPFLIELAERGLGRLRDEAPIELAERLHRDLQKQLRQNESLSRDRMMTLGRVIGTLSDAERTRCLVSLIMVADRTRLSAHEQFVLLWCLGTGMWTDRGLVSKLEEDPARRLLAFVEEVIGSLETNDVNLYHEAAIVLFALLRLRKTPLHFLVAAGSP